MEILQLKYFCDAAETENFSKTAKKFGVPPSNISQCIKRLECELGIKLFEHRSNSIVLNERGKSFFDKISTALNIIDTATAEMKKEDGCDEIRICIVANRRIVMKAIENFRILKPDVKFVISHKYSPDEEYEFVISDELFDDGLMEKKKIISEEIALAVKTDNPLAKKEEIVISDIKDENFISLNRGSSLYAFTERFCNKYGFVPNIVVQSDDPFYVRKCAELGLGVAFVPVFSWKGLFSDNIVLKRIRGFERNTYAYWKKNGILHKSAELFLQTLITECKNEI